MAKPSAIPGVLLPINGHYGTVEDFVQHIERLIEFSKSYEGGVAHPVGHKAKHDIKKLMSDHFKQD